MTNQDVFAMLDRLAPFDTQLDFDNAGLLVGDPTDSPRRIGVCLDVTPCTVAEAVEQGCNLMVSHHPVIFQPLRSVTADTVVYDVIRKGISVISAHTNLDAATGGVNDALANALGLQEILPLSDPQTPDAPPIGRMGTLSSALSPAELANLIRQRLGCGAIRFVDTGRPIQRVAVCGGAGSFLMAAAKTAGADAYLTSEVKHHEWLLAQQLGMCVLDGGHFSTEAVVLPPLCDAISKAFPQIDCVMLAEKEPYQTM